MVKRNLLTKTTTLSVVSVLALMVGGQAWGSERSGHHHHECSEDTLQGVYLFTATEPSPSDRPDSTRPFAAAGLLTFDGEGNMSAVASQSRNGAISQHVPATGTYTLDSDCTGTMTRIGPSGVPVHWDIFVAVDGSEGVAVRTDAGSIQIQTFKKP